MKAAGLSCGTVRLAGRWVRYAYRPGVGLPILFCNGIGANMEIASPFFQKLADRPVILFDVPGTGQSEDACFWPSFSAYGAIAVQVLDSCGFTGPFVVAGVSWGGGLAQQIARDCEKRVAGLILMATCAGAIMVPGRVSVLMKMATPRRYLSKRYMALHAAEIYGGEMRAHRESAVSHASVTSPPSVLAYLQQLGALAQCTSHFWLWKIKCPALVINGDDDPIIRVLNARILAFLLGNARLHIVRDGGHLFLVERADETAGVVARFLATVPHNEPSIAIATP